MMKFSKKTLVTVGAAGVLALGVAVPAAAWAAEGSDPAPAATSQDKSGQRAEHQQKLAEALAKELGVDQAKVSAALEKVQSQLRPDGKNRDKTGDNAADRTQRLKDRLAAAVKDGKLTQAEADAILKATEAGVLGGHGHSPDRASSPESGK
ncbi:hypothetical protein Cme02nite_35480 [Catellatospora methionotrophica]|uniref:Uncharacterized protein n=1 Tax=Catellatospora methionotrophica TaxID=121620 RepID=A0A8J3LHD9_9ACTN|nr:hypothetical protein [Catellatospora methionotrophica]GIG15216.1 hypothetical protein Cme02nite_35480 [Catellatospora methionotrophica]